ncbi:MAG: hypothetical protein ABIJ16_06970 [Bacteroidota bacterium]
MKYSVIIIMLLAGFITVKAQTVIEMTHPGDANLVLLEVDDPSKADIVVFRAEEKDDYQAWDCMWKFKQWGFSNFSVYLTKDEKDPKLFDDETGVQLIFNGKIYFSDNKEDRGYKSEGFMLEGVFRKFANNEEKKKKNLNDEELND